MNTSSKQQGESIVQFYDHQWFRYVVFLTVLLDVVGIMVYQGHHRQLYEHLALIVSGLISGVVTLARSIGWVDKASGAYFKNLDDLLKDHYVQFFVFFFTIVLALLLVFPGFFAPPQSSLSVKVYADSDPAFRGWAGELTLYRSEGQNNVPINIEGRPVKFNTWELFKNLETSPTTYKIGFRPFDEEMFATDSLLKKVDTPIDSITVRFKIHNLCYVLTPENAELVVIDHGVQQKLARGNTISLKKGTYTYEVKADTKFYDSDSGKFSVPRDTLRVALRRKQVTVTFVADRGLKPKEIIVPARLTLTQVSSNTKSTVTSGDSISLYVGEKYTVQAIAKESWDLAGRTYFGSQPIMLTREMNGIRITIPVTER